MREYRKTKCAYLLLITTSESCQFVIAAIYVGPDCHHLRFEAYRVTVKFLNYCYLYFYMNVFSKC